MKQLTAATLFSGGGIAECAMIAKGLEVLFGVEKDPNPKRAVLTSAIASAHELNFPKTKLFRESVENVNWRCSLREAAPTLPGDLFLLHGSPSCKNFSQANTDGKERNADVAAAKATGEGIKALKPLYFTLENVQAYAKSESFQIILDTLKTEGYAINYDFLNANDYGVPQDRKRLMLVASRIPVIVGFPSRQRPIGWIEVLQDRIPYLVPAVPTETQKIALKKVRSLYPTTSTFLVERVGPRNEVKIRHPYDPCFTLTTTIFTDGKGANRHSFLNIWHCGQWLDLTVRDCALLQTVPDWYILPPQTEVAGAIVGNGIPCKMYEAIIEQILAHYSRYRNVSSTND